VSSNLESIAVLKFLVAGKDVAFTAAASGLTPEKVRRIAQSHGYPDMDKVRWAIDVLTEEADKTADLTPSTEPLREGQPVNRPRPRPSPAPPAPAPRPDDILVLLNTGKGSESKRIQALANRIFDDIDRLRRMIKTAEEVSAARLRRERERKEAVEAVRKAEQELKKARARLRKFKNEGGNGRATVHASPSSESRRPGGNAAVRSGQLATARGGLITAEQLEQIGLTSKELRTWAHAHDVECPNTGRLPSRVYAAYIEAHKERGKVPRTTNKEVA
jgi:hypothetical protein